MDSKNDDDGAATSPAAVPAAAYTAVPAAAWLIITRGEQHVTEDDSKFRLLPVSSLLQQHYCMHKSCALSWGRCKEVFVLRFVFVSFMCFQWGRRGEYPSMNPKKSIKNTQEEGGEGDER
jgi:hypothetical protein